MQAATTPALKSGDDERIQRELSTILIALRRFRADVAAGRIASDRRLLAVDEIDELLSALNSCLSPAPSFNQRSASSWNAMARSCG